MSTRAVSLVCAAALVLSAAACSTDPERAKREYLESGNRYAAEGRFNEAIVQYRNAIQQDPQFGEARFKLAEAYTAVRDSQNAFREYIRAADLLPDDVGAQVTATTLLLASGQFEDAKTRAQRALEKHPRSAELQILLGRSLAGLKDFSAALKELEEAARLEDRPEAYTSIGAIQLAEGRRQEAEVAFRRAVELAPDSPAPHLALSLFQLGTGKVPEAEASLGRVVEMDPGNVQARRMLAFLLIATRRGPEAEPHLRALAEQDVTETAIHKIELADYYLAFRRLDDAVAVLEPIRDTPGAFAAVNIRLAAVEHSRNQRELAHKTVDAILAREPAYIPAILMKARFLAQEQKIDAALAHATKAVEMDPTSVEAQYLTGMLYGRLSRNSDATAAFTEVLRLNPRAVAAQVQLSRLSLAEGQANAAMQFAQDAARAVPGNPEVQITLARSLMAQGRTANAERILRNVARQFPDLPSVWVAQGDLGIARKNLREAREGYRRAYQLESTNPRALYGLAMADFREDKGSDAKRRIEAVLEKVPDNIDVLTIAGRTYAASGDVELAESTLRTVIDREPSKLEAYALLAQLYFSQNRLSDARQEFDRVAEKDPRAVGAMTMAALTHSLEGNFDEARKRYERVLQVDPGAAVAATNLAYLYAETGGNLEVALQLAQMAKSRLPDSPAVSDTLGWVLLKRGFADLAVPSFEESVRGEPERAVYRYHLGLALAKTGRRTAAREELNRALELDPDFAHAKEAREMLDSL